MSALPPEKPGTPPPAEEAGSVEAEEAGSVEAEEAGSVEAEEVPRWAAPAVPPPWAATGQPLPGQPLPGQPLPGQPGVAPGWEIAAAPRKPLIDRQKWLPTIVVAAIIAGVVLGGFALDGVLAAPSAGKVAMGLGVTITASPGWVRTDTPPSSGVELQKGDVILDAGAVDFSGTPAEALAEQEDALRSGTVEISFGTEKDGLLGDHDAALVDFSAIVAGEHGSGTIDGELICLSAGGRMVLVLVYAPQGDLETAVDDVLTMIKSIEVGK